MKPRSLMIQGCTSDAGKSALVTALCRLYNNQGLNVAPFKPQNMALNSAVSKEGGEIGRSQAVQAIAARVEPSVHMNPILIKPSSHTDAQVVVQGQALINLSATDYLSYKQRALEYVLDSYQRLSAEHDVIVIEGAGSPAEINLRDNDIANMGFAEAIDCPVVLVADIDRGGVFAHLVGTLALLSQSEQDRVIGFIINRFRGDRRLLESGLEWLEARTNKPVLAVMPYLNNFYLDAEDSIQRTTTHTARSFRVVIVVYPQVSNHTDFDALMLHDDVDVTWHHITQGPQLSHLDADLVILPGSKNVRSDLNALRANQWEPLIQQHLRYGGKLLGICGGYQILGHAIHDPHGVEGDAGSSDGLGLLPINTTLRTNKQLRNVRATLNSTQFSLTSSFDAYEIHVGDSTAIVDGSVRSNTPHFASLTSGALDGHISHDGLIIGTYLHGLFDQADVLRVLLQWAGLKTQITQDVSIIRDANIERIASALAHEIDSDELLDRIRTFQQHSQ
ncbi:MAG: cobyric acid synthase [Pseudomonadota bacterium]